MANKNGTGEIEFKIIDSVGAIAQYPTGWTKELNVVAWNGANPKFDIRDWDPDHEHMSRGITLHESEAKELSKLLEEQFSKEKEEAKA